MVVRFFFALMMALIVWDCAGFDAAATEQATPPKEITGKDGAPLVLIPSGPYPMGVPVGDRDGGRDEYPRHIIEIAAFYIDKYEVTNGRYLDFEQCCRAYPRHEDEHVQSFRQQLVAEA